MKAYVATSIALLLTLGVHQSSLAGIILQDQFSVIHQIQEFSPIGQTFTAEDPHIKSIGFGLVDFNPTLSNGITTMKLFEGAGLGGPLLDTAMAIVPPGTDGFFDFDFSSVVLTVGAIYTAIIERPNARWGAQNNQHTFVAGGPIPGAIDYPGGHLIFSGSILEISDMRFRVLPAGVPEPGTLALTGLSLLLFGWLGWRNAI